tara:strand:+ start:4690 stop:4983 length:294 start_codon:yes stop_codon:yes gene_type:complete
LAVVKSKLLKQLKKNWPNLSLSEINKMTDIVLNEIKRALRKGDRVELRSDLGIFYTKVQRARISRNPRTGEKVNTPSKRTVNFKMSKEMFKKINNEK